LAQMNRRITRKQEVTLLPKLESSLSHLLGGDLKKAESVLSKLDVTEDEYVKGYRDALQGIVNSLNSQDRKSFVFRLSGDAQFLRNELTRLKETEEAHLCTEWDLGYFKCWTSYLEGLLRVSASVKKQ